MSNQVLITGSAGFVGSHLADGLLAARHCVRISSGMASQNPANFTCG